MLEKGSFKFLPPSHWHECVLHVVTLKQSLQGSDSCEQRGGETASPAMLGFHHVKVLKIKISQRTNLHELWDYDPPVFSAITHGNKCYKSRLKPPSLPSSNPIIGSQGKHIFSYCKACRDNEPRLTWSILQAHNASTSEATRRRTRCKNNKIIALINIGAK